jgi:hypothetical protein
MHPVAQTIHAIRVGQPITHDKLTIWPLLGEDTAGPAYFTLDEALAQGWIRLTEVSDQGSVPEIRVVNEASRPVFLLDGEELVGAKQNRVVNLSMLVPASKATVIPVSCVEAGRWARRTDAFDTSPHVHFAAGRASRLHQVSLSMQALGERRSDQAAVWAEIADKASRLKARSPTAAMGSLFETHHAALAAYVRACPPCEKQRGAVFAVAGGVIGIDLFDRAWTLCSLLPKLVRSYALDAIDRSMSEGWPNGPVGDRPAAPEAVAPFLEAVAETTAMAVPALGEGRDVRLSGRQVTGAALVSDDRVVHLTAFGAAADFV